MFCQLDEELKSGLGFSLSSTEKPADQGNWFCSKDINRYLLIQALLQLFYFNSISSHSVIIT